jgi:hypothetical protein
MKVMLDVTFLVAPYNLLQWRPGARKLDNKWIGHTIADWKHAKAAYSICHHSHRLLASSICPAGTLLTGFI